MTVTLKKQEVLNRAYRFMKEFADADDEMGQVFGFLHKRFVSVEPHVRKLGGQPGRIDGIYPGKLLIEMKPRGEDLATAYGYKVSPDGAARAAFLFGLYPQHTGATAPAAAAPKAKRRTAPSTP